MCDVVKSAKMNVFCSKIEIIFPLSHLELEHLIRFLYHGQILSDNEYSISDIRDQLTNLLGFPENMEFSAGNPEMNFDIKKKEPQKNEFHYNLDPLQNVQIKQEYNEMVNDIAYQDNEYLGYENYQNFEPPEFPLYGNFQGGVQKNVHLKTEFANNGKGVLHPKKEKVLEKVVFDESNRDAILSNLKTIKYRQPGYCTFCSNVS